MFFKRKNWLSGYITIEIKGEYPERFFDLCAKFNIASWDIEKKNETIAIGKIKLADLPKLRVVKRKTIHKVYFKGRNGLPFFLHHLTYQKPLLIGFFIAIAVIFFMSNIVWRIDVSGLDEEIETKVIHQLEDYGLEEGSFQWNIASPATIQKQLLTDVPELLWIGVKRNGSAFHLEGVEKTIVEKEEEEEAGHLVATKEGVIEDLFVSRGQPLVSANDVVYQGDILVSGYLKESEEDDDERKPVAAEGEVIAKVWYKSEVTVPLDNQYLVLTGEMEQKHYLHISKYLIPIWNFEKPEYKHHQVDVEEKNFYFLKWKLPISYVKQSIYDAELKEEKVSKEKAKNIALEQGKRELMREIPHDAEITDEKVLHESVESGKVKLTLYYTVLENIAKKQPITQGD
ncbi:similar to stage IV sporulation protein [Gracilibacillus orientalis]|uniref:Similar to stage IV sporulation protein n=1 Tax=Gracilibacillus orientalis TaxID=334253 RepID=A0A1I4KRX4_9BACI|nr:sporulation protein YqfD [Gracilibacillus orientalis]SFL81356.1 similar to stage IV sporulation protein [Gracilibacillus orientalis]